MNPILKNVLTYGGTALAASIATALVDRYLVYAEARAIADAYFAKNPKVKPVAIPA